MTDQSPSHASIPLAAESPFLKHFEDQQGRYLVCVVRERIPGRMYTDEPDEYDSRTMYVDREYIERDLAGYLFHHYSLVSGLPVFEKYEGSR
jgi:hypothetical protein